MNRLMTWPRYKKNQRSGEYAMRVPVIQQNIFFQNKNATSTLRHAFNDRGMIGYG